ncbi:hypothetical protein ACIGN6_32125 [Streptomyces sp. NPDC053792]|uniref:hypothetical protein n=1 Tax=Streptomyces sp. NPDC053792 TaxID=3365716 RepID=UPI0037D8D772
MTGLTSLSRLIGAQALSDHLVARVNELVTQGTDYAEACATVTEAADSSEAWAIAATRQTWVRRPGIDADDAPIQHLYILQRIGDTVVTADLDLDADPAGHRNAGLRPQHKDLGSQDAGGVIDIELLNLYDLTKWEPFEHLLPTGAITTPGVTGVGE